MYTTRIRRIAIQFTILILTVGLSIGGLRFSLHPVHADNSTITVNSLSDDQTAGTGACVQSGTICLSNAIASADKAGVATTIVFSVSGTIVVQSSLEFTNANSNTITVDGRSSAVIIDGSGIGAAQVTIDTGAAVSLDYLTFSNGGGIWNYGLLTLSHSVMNGNTASYYNDGGAIYNNLGALSIVDSTIANNFADDWGGGVYNDGGYVQIDNSTISNNTARYGGGIATHGGTVTLLSNIVAENTSVLITGDIYTAYGTTSPILKSFGHNVIGIGSGLTWTTSNATDQIGTVAAPTDPKIDMLANNGGPTWTMALQTGSLAIGHGDCASSATDDQRGISRRNPCDAGAYEDVSFPTMTSTPSNTPTNTATFTLTPTSTSTSTAIVASTATNTSTPTGTFTLTSTSISTSTAISTSTTTPTNTLTATNTPIPLRLDTIGIYRAGTFYLSLHNRTGNADIAAVFNLPGQNLPVVGDWTGSGYDTIGVYNQLNDVFTLCTQNSTAMCASPANLIGVVFGNPGDTPLSGRWSIAAANAGVGIYRPTNGILYLKNVLTSGFADNAEVLGVPGDQGIAGDWTGKGFGSPGVYRANDITFYLSNVVSSGIVHADFTTIYGSPGDLPIAGDWIGQGHNGIGMFRPANGAVYLKNQISAGNADNSFVYGVAGDLPIAGHWQASYPIGAPSIMIVKTPTPFIKLTSQNGSVLGSNQIGG